jgi:outer membrane lipoprotein SlyB
MKPVIPLLICAGLVLSACATTTESEVSAVPAEIQPAADADVAANQLVEREAVYSEVFEQARTQGLLAGGLRGAILGALIDGERGALVGAVMGAVIGANYSAMAAEQLLQEREEFLNRQQIIQNILLASRMAADTSAEDALLVTRAVSAHSGAAGALDPARQVRIEAAVSTLRRAVELRSVLIEEVLQEADLSELDAAQVREQINRQRDALRRIRAQQELWSAQHHG